MKVWGVYDDELHELAAEVGLSIRRGYPKRVGNAYRFRLALDEALPYGGYRFQKRDSGGYGTSHVCWHGQREFLYALFRRFPEAVVDTVFDRYHGAAQFHARYRRTRDLTVPGFVSNAGRCTCPIRPKRRVRPRRQRVSFDSPRVRVEQIGSDAAGTTRTFTYDAARWQDTLQAATDSIRNLTVEWNTTEDSNT